MNPLRSYNYRAGPVDHRRLASAGSTRQLKIVYDTKRNYSKKYFTSLVQLRLVP